ncbi:MAG: ABC transporter permease [Roseiflexaceae bacterium]
MVGSGSPQTISDSSSDLLLYLNPLYMVREIWRHRSLIRQFTRREIESRYRGSFLGLFWLLVHPLMQLLIYTFMFGIVFRSRWGRDGSQSLTQFALILFCGLITFNIFGECINRAPGIIVGVPNYVKKVVFPLEILPVCRIGAALFHGSINVLVLLVANLLVNDTIQWTLLLLPLVALPLIFLSLGLTWFLSSLGVFLRDIQNLIGLVVLALFYASAIFYPIEVVPPFAQSIIHLNPLAVIVANFRAVLLWGMAPNWLELAFWLLVAGAIMMLGYAWFMKTKSAFADVI